MDEKYELMTLKYLYSLLNLKKYEETLDKEGFKSLISENEDFKYFSLLSRGDTELFTDDEKKELSFFHEKSLKEIFSNKELEERCVDFIKSTYLKYYFSNANGEYIYYGPYSFEYMAPDDAFVLGINYRMYDVNDDEDLDESMQKKDAIATKIINDIQFTDAKNANLKVAVLKQNERDILNKGISL